MSEEAPMRPGANPVTPLPPPQVILPEDIRNPDITENVLNAMLLEGLSILRDARELYRISVIEPHERGQYVAQSVNVMKASTELAAMIARLKTGETKPETIQRVIVERIARGEGEGGGAIPKNE